MYKLVAEELDELLQALLVLEREHAQEEGRVRDTRLRDLLVGGEGLAPRGTTGRWR